MYSPKTGLNEFFHKRIYVFLFLLNLMAAFVIRMPYLFAKRMWPDEALYAWYAQNIFNNPSFIFSKEAIKFHPPFFSILLALSHCLWLPDLAFRFVPLIFSLLGLGGIYLLGQKIKNPFTGLIVSILLSFNFVYLLLSTYILTDLPLTVTGIFLALCLFNVRSAKPDKSDVYVGLLMAIMILLKWTGILSIFFVSCYYLLGLPEISLSQRRKKLLGPVVFCLLLISFLGIRNKLLLGSFLPEHSALQEALFKGPVWYYLSKIKMLLTSWYLIPFFIYGVFETFHEKQKTKALLFSWMVVSFLGISLIPEKTPRYGLLMIPSMLLICAIGLESALHKSTVNAKRRKIAKAIALACVIVLSGFSYVEKKEIISRQAYMEFYGFKEAGQWLKRYASSSDTIFTTSKRAIRYYSGFLFDKEGGPLKDIPPSREEFESQIKEISQPVFLVSDIWTYRQPSWIFPPTTEKFKYLNHLGFKPALKTFRPALFESGQVKITAVIRIFEKRSSTR